ncbi:50S ribosomal protein L29 [Patescibacteria group bacterium]|nr:50S ribosomal protein L29 [Patescibacteria group bacterium]MCG2694562.1 50S ribosomal protein L29 [Candidatus Parcubacteria bacterium]
MKNLEKKTEKDLQKMIAEKKETLRCFRFGSSGSKSKNVKEGVNTRKNIARILTELKGRESLV